MQLYTDVDREFEDYELHEKKSSSDIVQMFLSGKGLCHIFQFLAKKYPQQSKLLEDKDSNFENIKPEDISKYAEMGNDELCLATVNYFIDYLAKFLSDISFTFMPLGGIYLTSSVIIAMEFMFERPEVKSRFLDIFQNRGGMSSILKRIPITVVKKEDLATSGCITYALFK